MATTATARSNIDIQDTKRQLKGRAAELLQHYGMPAECFTGKKQPCPKCGGEDRFRFDRNEEFCFCNQCHREGNGNAIDNLAWFTGTDFARALKMCAEYVGTAAPVKQSVKPTKQRKTFPDLARAVMAVNHQRHTVEAQHEYRTADGELVYVKLRLRKADGGKTFQPLTKLPNGQWYNGGPDGQTWLYGLDTIAGVEEMQIYEGERTTDAARSMGYPALTWADGAKAYNKADWSPLTSSPSLKRVNLFPDNDKDGRDAMQAVAAIIRKLNPAIEIRIVEVPGVIELGDKADIADLVASYPGDTETPRKETQSAIDAAEVWKPQDDPTYSLGEVEHLEHLDKKPGKTKAVPQLKMVNLAKVVREDIQWLWPGRIPLGKVTQFAGNGGVGKSFLSCDLATRVTRGLPWPDGEVAPFGNVIMLNAEDGLSNTIQPRLENMGARLDRVEFVQGVQCGDEYERQFSFKNDMELLEQKANEIGDVALIVIDPISSYLIGIDVNNSGEVRQALDPLKVLAERTNAAVIFINHLTKGNGSALHRASGSVALTAMTRASWAIIKDPDDPLLRLFLPTKFNVGPEPTGMAYRVSEDGHLEWQVEAVTMTADEALEHKPGNGNNNARASDLAESWLRDYLASGPIDSDTIFVAGPAAGHSKSTLYRVKDKLGIKAAKEKGVAHGKWFWELPASPTQDTQLPQHDDLTF